MTLKSTLYLLVFALAMWFPAVGAVIFAIQAFSNGQQIVLNVANGVIYFAGFLTAPILVMSVIYPSLLLLRPHHLYSVRHAFDLSLTPRQRFRGRLIK